MISLLRLGIFLLSISYATAQFASEAGLRFFGSFGNPSQLSKKGLGRMHAAPSFATGDQTQYLNLQIRGDFRVAENFVLYLNLPVRHVMPNDAPAHTAFSDPLLAVGYELPFDLKANFTVNAGFLLPSQNANRLHNGMAFPMSQQSSLGSADLLLGFTFEHQGLLLGLAFQQPLTENQNRFSGSSATNIPSSNYLRRGADLALRMRQTFNVTPKLGLFVNLMPIIRLSDDKYLNDAFERVIVRQSKGQTFNGSFGAQYTFSKNNNLFIEAGAPLYYRRVFADGTLRYFFAEIRFVRDLQIIRKKAKVEEDADVLGATAPF
jgi:hypothetical protein